MFNKKQLIVMWCVGLLACYRFVSISLNPYDFALPNYVVSDYQILYPALIIGALLVMTLTKRQR